MQEKKKLHKLLSILLCFMLVAGMMPAMGTTAFAASEIKSLGVTGLSPIFDGKSSTDSTYQSAGAAGDDYGKYYLFAVVWYDNADRQEENEFTGTFQAGKKYYVETWFKAKDGYVFDDRANLTPKWYGPDYFKMIDYEVTGQNSRAYVAFEITCLDFVDGLDIWLKGYEPGKKAEDIKVTLNSDPAGSAFLRGTGQYGDSYYIRDTCMKKITGPLEAGETYDLIVNYDVADGYEDDGVGLDGLQEEKIILNGHMKATSLYADRQIRFRLPAPHTYQEQVISEATTSKNGTVRKVCSDCGDDITEIIYYPKTIKLSYTSTTYNGKAKSPTVSVVDAAGNKLVEGTDYDVTVPTGRVNAGKYTYKVVFKGKYSGSKTLTLTINQASYTPTVKGYSGTYDGKKHTISLSAKSGSTIKYRTSPTGKWTTTKPTRTSVGKTTVYYQITNKNYKTKDGYRTIVINPVKTSITSLSKGTKSFTVKWAKKTTQTTGYQIQYSTSRTFESGNKTVTVTSNKMTSKTIKSLKAKKKYYVRVRTYKTVDGVKYYSGWSAKKYVTTK